LLRGDEKETCAHSFADGQKYQEDFLNKKRTSLNKIGQIKKESALQYIDDAFDLQNRNMWTFYIKKCKKNWLWILLFIEG
jgi:hypothetical protein